MNKLYKTPVITSIVMLLLALFDLPEGYYTLLRIIVCGTAVYLGFIAKGITKISWVWALGFIAILFNPVFSVHLDREMWAFIDIVVGFIFFVGIFALSGEGATKFFPKIWAFTKKIYKKELIILVMVLLTGFIILMSSVLFQAQPKRKKVYELLTPEGWALVNKVWNYQSQHQEYKNLSALELAEKLAKENPEYQKDYDSLKAISEENRKKHKFDVVTAKSVEEKPTDRILDFIKNNVRREKISKFGFFIVIFGYPVVLFIRFIIWTIKAPKQKQK